MEGFNAGTITIVLSIFGTGILVMLFQWRQSGAMEKRLRDDIQRGEDRLREDAKGLEDRLREDAKGLEGRLREEIRESEDRLREDAKSLEGRLREEIRESEDRLREDARATEGRLRGEIQVVAKSVERVEINLSHRLDRTDDTDDKVNFLTQDIGVVQGALIGVSTETMTSREPALPN